MAKFKHYILTRFNLLTDELSIYNNPNIPDPNEWMEHRIELWKHTNRSIINQTTKEDFIWLMSFDKRTPTKYLELMLRQYILITHQPIFCYHKTYLNQLYKKGEIKDGDWIITSRLDNDDFVEPTWIEEIQSQFDYTFKLVDTDGCQLELATGKYYDTGRTSNNSPFISLIEQVGVPWKDIIDPIKTVFYCSHTKMEWHFPSVKIPKRLYTMVIHDRNVSNKIVGAELND